MGVEPISDRKTCHPPVLKTGTITGPHALPCLIINKLHDCHCAIVIHPLGSKSPEAKVREVFFLLTQLHALL
jgi:hypothetical protein